MLGAIAGDIIGSVFEWNAIKTTEFPLFSADSTFTDDTVLTIATADAILHQRDYAANYKRFARAYPHAGYGGSFRGWFLDKKSAPYNSFGNGSAMRVSPVGYAFETLEQVLDGARRSAAPSHGHPEGIKGAQATAAALWWARQGWGPEAIRQAVTDRFGYDLSRTPDEIRPHYRHTESCQGSVPPAIVCALAATDFEDAIRTAVSIGGDSDTIAAIAGSIAEARFGIPEAMVKQTWSYLPNDMRMVLIAVYAKRGETLPKGTLGLTFT